MNGLRQKIINGRKRDDEFATTHTQIPKLKLNNASFRIASEVETSDDIRNICSLVGKKNQPEKDTHSARMKKYHDEMQQLNPAYQRYSKSLSMYILQNTLKYTNDNIFKKSAYYEKKHNLTRMEFIKIYNLYVSLSFITIKNKLQKEQSGTNNDTKNTEKKTRNMQDFSGVSIDGAGIDLKTLMNDGFPQLKFENAMVIEKLFENIRREMDVRTKRVTFDSFLSLVKSFMTTDIDIKVNRFFQLIDEDGNGELSMDEILNLC